MRLLYVAICLAAVSCITEFILKFLKVHSSMPCALDWQCVPVRGRTKDAPCAASRGTIRCLPVSQSLMRSTASFSGTSKSSQESIACAQCPVHRLPKSATLQTRLRIHAPCLLRKSAWAFAGCV